MGAWLEGVSMGLLLSAMIGPVFFTLIQSSLEHGFRYAMALAFGILVSDTFYVLVTYFGISLLVQFPSFEQILGFGGGFILVGFGVGSLVKKDKPRPNSGGLPVAKGKKKTAFLKGFSINGINPFVLLFWISIASLVGSKQNFSPTSVFLYYFGILGTVFLIDLIKAFVAKKLAKFITPKITFYMNKAVGIILIGFGLRMLYLTWFV
ncbi:LysE family translocator [Algoriphagus sp. PAP.12]|uniref:LysE family translocator n=1 Tax=Algoriphagus sp. PAP.12 TaxID=2996678 RepID=UPI002DD443F9|nr:LysE family translocator [Algoriphagus sp. PAP.12]